ncbi:MAG: aldo/keto reductase [Firmicutes bacterium]|nr:aldo/keto reductase [Bacillota bacterium]
MKIASIADRAVLNNGVGMPWLGLGVFRTKEGEEVERAVKWALEAGYRSIDTAAVYRNERGVGKAIRASGIPREEIFVTTKVWNDDLRAGTVRRAFQESLDRLGLDYVDLYLIHWPVKGRYIEAWKVMEEIYRSGKAKAVGVSNFLRHHLEDLLAKTSLVPAVNQIEFHPLLVQPDLLRFCREHGIQVEAWSPLMQGHVVEIPEIRRLAEKYGKTPAQIVLRWDLQHEVVTIPKSVHRERILENMQIFDFELSAEDMALLDGLDAGRRFGSDPDHFDF